MANSSESQESEYSEGYWILGGRIGTMLVLWMELRLGYCILVDEDRR